MIVYGDPQFRCRADEWLDALTLGNTAEEWSLDGCRRALIRAGQLEQALADLAMNAAASAAAALTDAYAAQFVTIYGGATAIHGDVGRAIDVLRKAVREIDAEVTLKVPEGFAFYSLFPEQYIVSAERWHEAHHRGTEGTEAGTGIGVIGLRSIGTTLSAVVAATLRGCGYSVRRCTVRPFGHPFERQVVLPAEIVCGADYALVVDEGPGLSGSSMAAAAEALSGHGIGPECITFMPAHDSEPGSAASPQVRSWWSRVQRYTTDVQELRWGERGLLDVLRDRAVEHFGRRVVVVEDASGGLWRRIAYEPAEEWPAVAIAFERAKYLMTLERGERVMWTFRGFETPSDRRSVSGLIQPIAKVASAHGFVCQPWIEGRRLCARDLTDELLFELGRYIGSCAQEPIAVEDAAAAFERLSEMLLCNAREGLGESAVMGTREIVARCRDASASYGRVAGYGDGRLSPHEFVRTSSGAIYKADAEGHDCDHTIIGRQPIWWDLAGAIVEWHIRAEKWPRLLEAAGLRHPEAPVLNLYCAAYAAFRLGVLSMNSDEAEADRVARQITQYRDCLSRSLFQVNGVDDGRGVVHGNNADGAGVHCEAL